jgi:hypothetical protein
MKTYKLTAELGSVTTTRTFQAAGDDAAAMDSIFFIMDEAYRQKSGPWAKGQIQLTNSRGKVLQQMGAK